MKILYILPDETVKSGGNWVTATRLAEGLKKRGFIVDIIEAKDVTKECLKNYDVIHAFHVFKTLVKINDLLINMDKIVVVSFTGTDLKQLQKEQKNKEEIIDILNSIDRITVFHDEAKEELIKEGIISGKIRVIPQTAMPIEVQDSVKVKSIERLLPPDCINFLFAAGIRKVKAPLEMIDMMSKLVEKIENIRLILIGPILEEDLGEKVIKKIEGKEWAKYIGEVSHQETQYFISKSDIVINTSHSEGMSNTLIEAQQLARPILATDNCGNRSVVTHGADGFLFKDNSEFEYFATKLALDGNLRRKMGERGFEFRKTYGWEQEVDMYEQVYKS